MSPNFTETSGIGPLPINAMSVLANAPVLKSQSTTIHNTDAIYIYVNHN